MSMLFQDTQLVVYNKPIGEPSQPDRKGEASALRNAESAAGSSLYTVHRIDQSASGLLVFARSSQTAALLSELLRAHDIQRRYLAIVSGTVEPTEGRLEHRLTRDGRTNKSRPSSSGKPAELTYQTLARGDRYTLLDVQLWTGRHHQIRAQLSACGWPIRGDVKYGARRSVPGGGICLHGYSLSIPRPDGSRLVATAPPPERDIWFELTPDEYLTDAQVTQMDCQ